MGKSRSHSATEHEFAAGNRAIPANRRGWHLPLPLAFVVGAAGVFIVAQACGGGSRGADVAPTATPEPTSNATRTPTSAADGETPVASGPEGGEATGDGDSIGFPPGGFGGGAGQGLFNVAGPSEEFADFLGISQVQLESELGSEGATPGSVAEAHGRSREELSSFLIGQIEKNLGEAVDAGTLAQATVDNLLENLTSNIEAIVDGEGFVPGGGFGGGAGQGLLNVAGPSEEFAAFLGISQAQLESELAADGATPGTVADAHGRTRDELTAFLIGQANATVGESVDDGTLTQEAADDLLANFASNIEAIIDGEGFAPGGGFAGGFGRGPGQGLLNVAGPSDEFAAFLGIPLDQLESELGADGATPGSVAGAHGRTRAQLGAFLIEQAEANLSESVAGGTLTQEAADNFLENIESNIEAIIDGEAFTPGGVGPGG